jgi:cell division transport system ATP-binding protein
MEETPIIEVENIPVYQKSILILSNVSFQIMPGEMVYLIGKTGSGKSSLLRTLYADIPVLDGKTVVAGFDLRKIRDKEVPYLRRKLGIIFQDFQLLMDRTVNENLIFLMKASGWKDKKLMQEQLQDVLVKVGLSTKGFKMPNQLSGGEQQRVGIARALINNPEVILADEPTGNLDPETSFGIVRLLKEISESGKSVLIATHNYSLIEKYPSRILKCEDGKVYSSV